MLTVLNPIRLTAAEHRRAQRGVTSTELLVACVVLTSAMTFVMPLVVKQQRVMLQSAEYRLALDEVENQLERLSLLSLKQLQREINEIEPSPFIRERLHGIELKGQLEPVDLGYRLSVRLAWDQAGRHEAPLTLHTWIARTDERLSGRTLPDKPSTDGGNEEQAE